MDRQLVQRSQRGDLEAFSQLVEAHQDAMYHLAWKMLGSPTDAADVVQEAFLRALRGLGEFHGKSSFRTWLYRITVHCCLNHLRHRQRRPEAEYFDEVAHTEAGGGEIRLQGQVPRPDTAAELGDLRAAIDAALGELSPGHRLTFVLREYNGLSYKEIADVTGVSLGTVMSRLHYARNRLQQLLVEFKPEVC